MISLLHHDSGRRSGRRISIPASFITPTLLRLLLLLHTNTTTTLLRGVASYSIGSSDNTWTYHCPNQKSTSRLSAIASWQTLSASNGNVDEVGDIEYYKSQAEQLRNEIEQFEQQKRRDNEIFQQQQNELLNQQKQLQDRYSAIVPILKPDGTTVMERCMFTPIRTDETSYITTIESDLPLGIIIGEVTNDDRNLDDGDDNNNNPAPQQVQRVVPYIVIDEIAPHSHGERNDLRVGDILHACTACKVDMELPTWQLLLGGIGRPKTNRYMHSIGTTVTASSGGASPTILETTMNAIASNRLDPEQRPILLVVERRLLLVVERRLL